MALANAVAQSGPVFPFESQASLRPQGKIDSSVLQKLKQIDPAPASRAVEGPGRGGADSRGRNCATAAPGAARLLGGIQLTMNEPPNGVCIQKRWSVAEGVAVLLRADGKTKLGLRGNLILDAFVERPAEDGQEKKLM